MARYAPAGRYAARFQSRLGQIWVIERLAPRVHNEGSEVLKVSPQVPEQTVRELAALGHKVERAASLGGPANMVRIDPASGRIDAASEAGPAGVQVL